MKYSVIIPIYNAEKTLRRCLDSLLPQLNSDIEVLLINDGSTDSSGDICNEYLAVCESFKYYEQKNAGASASRNKGIENSAGDYVLFIDSDDYVDSEYVKIIDECLQQSHADLLIYELKFLNRDQIKCNSIKQTDFYSGIDSVKKISYLSKKQQMHSLCDKVFVRQIIIENNLHFNSNISIGEDSSFVFRYTLHINSLSVSNQKLYYVDESADNSLSRKERKNLCNDLIVSYKDNENHLANISMDYNYRKEFQKILSRAYYRTAYTCFLEISRWNCSNAEKKEEITKVCLAYKAKRIEPIGFDTRLFSVPVLCNLSWLIVFLLRLKH